MCIVKWLEQFIIMLSLESIKIWKNALQKDNSDVNCIKILWLTCYLWLNYSVHITGSIIRDPALWDPRTSRHRSDQTSTNDTIPIVRIT